MTRRECETIDNDVTFKQSMQCHFFSLSFKWSFLEINSSCLMSSCEVQTQTPSLRCLMCQIWAPLAQKDLLTATLLFQTRFYSRWQISGPSNYIKEHRHPHLSSERRGFLLLYVPIAWRYICFIALHTSCLRHDAKISTWTNNSIILILFKDAVVSSVVWWIFSGKTKSFQ